MIVRSALLSGLGVRHGFSTRVGGVSIGPFASLNLGNAVGDDHSAVQENHARLAKAAGVSGFVAATQVHGYNVAHAVRFEPLPVDADAVVTVTPGVAVAVKTADCTPILLCDPRSGAVAAVHAGWRGTRLRIVSHAVDALLGLGAKPQDLLAVIGPCIRRCCYEVSTELAAEFRAEFSSSVVSGRMLDLTEANRAALIGTGLDAAHVEILAACTACEPERFFSHRRDSGKTGRHLSFIESPTQERKSPGSPTRFW